MIDFSLICSKYLVQILAAISGSLSFVSSGINLGWTSPYLPQLLNSDSDLSMTNDEGSWCAVMPLIGLPPGALIAAHIVDKIGRKNAVLAAAPITFCMTILIAFTKSIYVLFGARFILGSIEGFVYTVLLMYYGEISSPEIRGVITASIVIGYVLGTLLINIIGFYTTIFTSSLISSLIPLIHFGVFVFMPESPYYFLKKNEIEKARNSLQRFRGSKNVESELALISKAVERQQKEEKGRIIDLFMIKHFRSATLLFMIACFTKKYSGKNPITFYTVTIFEQIQSNFSPKMGVIIYVCVELFVSTVALFFIDRIGRKPLIVFSALGCAFCLILESIYFYLEMETNYDITTISWLPLIGLILYNICYCTGLELGPTLILGELFPTKIKAIACALGDSFSVFNGAIASKVFQITKDAFGIYVPFGLFALCCIFGIIFLILYMPETKGKSLEDIQLLLMGVDSEKTKRQEDGVKGGTVDDLKGEPV